MMPLHIQEGVPYKKLYVPISHMEYVYDPVGSHQGPLQHMIIGCMGFAVFLIG